MFDYVGSSGNDIFNAPLETLGNAAVMTLQPFTAIDGNGGYNVLNAVLNGSVTPVALDDIQEVNVTTSAAATLGLINAPDVESIMNIASTNALTVSGIAAGADLNVISTNQASTFEFASTTGTQSVDLYLQNSTGAVTIAGIETINITSGGTAANSVALTAAAATTINVDSIDTATRDDNALTITGVAAATLIDATGFNANFAGTLAVAGTLIGGLGNDTLTGAADVAATIIGGNGNDSIIAGAAGVAHSDSMSGGAGNDTITFGAGFVAGNATAALNDTVDGGTGTNTLVLTAANAEGVTAAATTIDNIQTLTLSSAGTDTATLQVALIDSTITTVNLGSGAGATYTVNMNAGSSTLTLGAATGATLLTVNDSGTALTDSLTISNSATTGTVDMFAGAVTVAGYETLTINTGTVATALQAITTLTVNTDATATAPIIVFSGANAIDIATSLTTSSTGLMTVNGSGLTATTGTVLDINSMSAGTGGTFSITGSAGNDAIATGNFASTVFGGSGNDSITGGTGTADSIHGDAGIDVLDGGTGNDTIKGGEGNDAITAGTGSVSIDGGANDDSISLGSTLDSTDTIDGGAGNDTLVVTAAVTTPAAGNRVTNVEYLDVNLATALSQDLSMFGNTTITRLSSNTTAANITVTEAGSTFDTITLTGAAPGTVAVSRSAAADAVATSLTVNFAVATPAAETVTALTASDEITLTLNAAAAANDVVLTTLTAAELTTLNITGAGDMTITNAIAGSTTISTITNSQTGAATLSLSATNNTSAITFTAGASTGRSTVTTGSGNDVITAGSGSLYATGGNGNDLITGGTTTDSLTGGAGNDTINGGAAIDTLTGGTGVDQIYLGSDAVADSVIQAGGDSQQISGVALTGVNLADYNFQFADQIFNVNATAATDNDTITVGNYNGTTLNLTFNNTQSTSNVFSVEDNTGTYIRGNFNATTGGFLASTTGADTLLAYDSNSGVAVAVEVVVLVGFTGTLAGSAAGVITS